MQALKNVLFDQIGQKAKTLALISFIIGFIGSTIGGIIYMYDFEEYFLGFLIWVAGTLISWASSIIVYGFGELIDKTTDIAANTSDKKA